MMRYFHLLLVCIFTFSCIETDVLQETADPALISIQLDTEENISLMLEDNIQLNYTYTNEYGQPESVNAEWESSHPQIASVNNGLITALAVGVAEITITHNNTFAGVRVTVVDDLDDVASLVISFSSTTKNNLAIGESITLQAQAKNINGEVLSNRNIEWFSENDAILTVNQFGLVTAIAIGTAEIHAKSEGVKSNSIIFSVGASTVRTGTFVSAGGYQSSGSVTVSEVATGVQVQLSANFSASIAAGTFIYLANSTNGANVKSSGLELGQYTPTGTKTFITSQATLQQYQYVVVLCKPFGITFGYAQLTP
ncbi:MAG: DM13 domain-containing protein [Cyclobacteriaceae bacterium]|jgi:hypothetical protein|nr:DM13 domain-containing protein [Cyclobacteriaceae bacterium]